MRRTRPALLFLILPILAALTAIGLWRADAADEGGAPPLAAVGRDPVARTPTAQRSAEDLDAIPLAPPRPTDVAAAEGAEELAAVEREARREVLQPEADPRALLETARLTLGSDDMVRILTEGVGDPPLIVNAGSTFRIYAARELRVMHFPGEALSEGLNATEHSPGVPRSQGYVEGGLKTGSWTTWYANGERESEGRYTYGEKHGAWTTWHDSGEKATVGEYLYGEREGPWVEYHANGKKSETATYVNGKRDGRVANWHVNGARKAESFYSYGRQHLEFREWYVSGQESRRGTFDYGRQVGRMRAWNSDGSIDESLSGVYENGQRVRD